MGGAGCWEAGPAISIHALREEGDVGKISARRVRNEHFYPRPPRGGRPQRLGVVKIRIVISIHALREEGDRGHTHTEGADRKFLSTPSARRATPPCGLHVYVDDIFLSTPSARRATGRFFALSTFFAISIHALREEGDPCPLGRGSIAGYFYPRPPRGGRRSAPA